MHPFVHPFTPAISSPWEAKQDWDHFKAIAEKFSELASQHLGTRKDLVTTPLFHDTPGELGDSEAKTGAKEKPSLFPENHAFSDRGDARLSECR